jgi:hypothetical protein
MRAFLHYLLAYLRSTSRPALLITTLFVAALIATNYTFGIERHILAAGPWYVAFAGFFLFYEIVIAAAWGLQCEWRTPVRSPRFFQPRLVILLLLVPLFFAAKMVHWDLSPLLPANDPWNHYWLIVLQLPAKLLLLFGLLFACRKTGLLEEGGLRSVGLTTRGFDARPYFGLLLLLVPVVALAATQPDFLHVYPKVKNVAFIDGYASPVWPWKLGYELSYGLDFLSIELFFRGLLVIGFVRYAGEQAILPMAAFYCTIHFGKPMAECISSFFGGLILGVLAYRTRSILGGLIVHLGLAWMMELGGWLGHSWLG